MRKGTHHHHTTETATNMFSDNRQQVNTDKMKDGKITVIDGEQMVSQGMFRNVSASGMGESGSLNTSKQGDLIDNLKKQIIDLSGQVKKRDQAISHCTQIYMTITQMAHFLAVKDMAIQLKIQSMARTYQSTIKPFMHQDGMMEVESKMDPVVDPHNQRVKAELKKGVEDFVPKDGKFAIKDADLN
jgi:hypothetical protein